VTVAFGTLLLELPGQPPRTFELQRGSNIIGRDPQSAVHVDAEGVSRQHARVLCTPAVVLLVDEGSTNGTFVNGRRLATDERHVLRDGDVVQIGMATLRFTAAPDTRPRPPATSGRGSTGSTTTPPPRPSVSALPRPRRQSDARPRLRAGLLLPQIARPSRYMRLLPPVYHTEPQQFFNRFLLIFESVLGPLERVVGDLAHYTDPRMTPEELLPWLESWLGLTLTEELPYERRVELVRRAGELYRWRGTRTGLVEYLRIVAGVEPIIVEPGQPVPVDGYPPLPQHVFLVLFLVPEPAALDAALLTTVIDSEKPAHTGYYLDIRKAG
jgi:phage tail-like protein